MGMDDKTVDWFSESNRYAVALMEQGLKAEQEKYKHREQKIVANGAMLADLVQVVRCKDCKYRYTAKSGLILCTKHITMTPKDDDFCSYGKRRGGE